MLRFGKDTNNAIALIWDQPKSKLYLDLNRNLDLTDDPAGVFSSTNKGPQQLFANVTVPLKTAAGLHPAMLDLRLSVRRGGAPDAGAVEFAFVVAGEGGAAGRRMAGGRAG